MKEEIITLETAKLAKQKGFQELVTGRYIDHTCYGKDIQFRNGICFRQNHNKEENCYSAPSQSLLQRWLREKQSIHITMHPTKSIWFAILYDTKGTTLVDKEQNGIETFSKNYEEALEKGLQKALELVQEKS